MGSAKPRSRDQPQQSGLSLSRQRDSKALVLGESILMALGTFIVVVWHAIATGSDFAGMSTVDFRLLNLLAFHRSLIYQGPLVYLVIQVFTKTEESSEQFPQSLIVQFNPGSRTRGRTVKVWTPVVHSPSRLNASNH